MDAVKYIKELNRMCEEAESCASCAIREAKDKVEEPICANFRFHYPEETVAIVEKWSAEHPAKTNRDKFFEVFGIDPRHAGYVPNHNRAEGLAAEWWDRAYEVPKKE